MADSLTHEPLVSVVMPTFKQSNYIGMAIDSVLGQTYKNIELIIIDNYSNDGTYDIVAKYLESEKRVKYEMFNNNGCIANSRNRAIDISTGEYVAFLDSDDVWHNDKLKLQIPLFMDDNIALVYCLTGQIDSAGRLVSINNSYNMHRGYVFGDLLSQTLSIANSSVVIRRSAIDQHNYRFRTNRQGAEDLDLWLRIADKYNYDLVEKVLVSYRVHSMCESRNKNMMYNSSMLTLNDMSNYIKSTYVDDVDTCKMLLNDCDIGKISCMIKRAHECIGEGLYCTACALAGRILSMKPFSANGWLLLARTGVYPLWKAIR